MVAAIIMGVSGRHELGGLSCAETACPTWVTPTTQGEGMENEPLGKTVVEDMLRAIYTRGYRDAMEQVFKYEDERRKLHQEWLCKMQDEVKNYTLPIPT